VSFCKNRGINRILYDNWGTGSLNVGIGRQPPDFLRRLICTSHQQGLKVEALYTDNARFNNVIAYHAGLPSGDQGDCGPGGYRFDGIRMNFEGPWPSGGGGPSTVADIEYFVRSRVAAGDVPLYASIGWHWNQGVVYNGNMKPAYEHIIDATDGVDIQVGWAAVPGEPVGRGADEIARRAQPIVTYANRVGKPAWITIYTQVLEDGRTTFAARGEAAMLAELGFVAANANLQGAAPAGFTYHFYLRSDGSGSPEWPVHT
jgi:hypothetical protein